MDNIQASVGHPKITKINDFAKIRPMGFITWQFFEDEKKLNFARQLKLFYDIWDNPYSSYTKHIFEL
jgi:hypothetical protein